jgi:hypothetical protein
MIIGLPANTINQWRIHIITFNTFFNLYLQTRVFYQVCISHQFVNLILQEHVRYIWKCSTIGKNTNRLHNYPDGNIYLYP